MSSEIIISRSVHPNTQIAYNDIIKSDSLLYRPLSQEEFSSLFCKEGILALCASNAQGELCGFLFASPPASDGVAYLSFFAVLPRYRGRKIACALLSEAERILRDECRAQRIDILFRDPVHLPWIIPDTADGHPCAPGILSGSAAERLLVKRGYYEWCAQIAYYIDLGSYSAPPRLLERREALRAQGIDIRYYDSTLDTGFYELFDAIRNPSWREQVLSHTDRPIAVAIDRNKNFLTVGYTGPFSNVREGAGVRGNFCGIGTHPDYRGRGIGTQLFCFMCEHHRASGATFMSLYTGESNPARKVYETAGARIAARWSNLRLDLSK